MAANLTLPCCFSQSGCKLLLALSEQQSFMSLRWMQPWQVFQRNVCVRCTSATPCHLHVQQRRQAVGCQQRGHGSIQQDQAGGYSHQQICPLLLACLLACLCLPSACRSAGVMFLVGRTQAVWSCCAFVCMGCSIDQKLILYVHALHEVFRIVCRPNPELAFGFVAGRLNCADRFLTIPTLSSQAFVSVAV